MIKQKNSGAVGGGFTLIELLIVMAVLGVLAVVVLVAINPAQQLARARDAGRKSGVTQIGHALAAYYTTRSGEYPDESEDWLTDLVSAGEIATTPAGVLYNTGPTACETFAAGSPATWCYDVNTTNAIVFARLESVSERSKCGAIVDTANPSAWFIYSVSDGRGGLVCNTGTDPTAPAAGGSINWSATS